MATAALLRGPKFEIRAWVSGGECQVLDFLENLEKDAQSDYERLMYLIKRSAEHGPPTNVQHVRPLGDDIFEFKGTRTSRILFFYDKGRLIICSHGFTGKRGSEKRDVAEQKGKASKIRETYFQEKGDSNG
jgi:hypothetical protein